MGSSSLAIIAESFVNTSVSLIVLLSLSVKYKLLMLGQERKHVSVVRMHHLCVHREFYLRKISDGDI